MAVATKKHQGGESAGLLAKGSSDQNSRQENSWKFKGEILAAQEPQLLTTALDNNMFYFHQEFLKNGLSPPKGLFPYQKIKN